MVMLNVFNADAFSFLELNATIDKIPFRPQLLDSLGIFEPAPVRTTFIAVEERDGQLVLVPFSDRGAPGVERTTELRNVRRFEIPRLMHEDTIYAHELQNIRAFGTETEMMQVQEEVTRRLAGPTGILSNILYTKEYHKLAAVQGQLLNTDGSVKFDWFEEFGVTRPTPIEFNLANGTLYSLRPLINNIIRAIARGGQGAFIQGQTEVYALCGDQFYDALVNHPDVEKTYLNWSAAIDLRNGTQGAAFDSFPFGGIRFINYRGSDDQTTINIGSTNCAFFPVGAPGVFKEAMAPYEGFGQMNTPGKPVYVVPVMDRDRDQWWKMEAYAYTMPICTRPAMLQTGTM